MRAPLQVDPAILARSEDLARKTPLRANDAIHVAAAEVTKLALSATQEKFILLTGDRNQAAVAQDLGIDVEVNG